MWEEFPPISTAEWEAAIRADLKGADYDKKLALAHRRRHHRAARSIAPRICRPPPGRPASREPGRWRRPRTFPKTPCAAICCTSKEPPRCRKSATRSRNPRAKRNTFVFSVGTNYFFEIAKLRAARQLWARLSSDPDDPLVENVASTDKSLYDPCGEPDALHDGSHERDIRRLRLSGDRERHGFRNILPAASAAFSARNPISKKFPIPAEVPTTSNL